MPEPIDAARRDLVLANRILAREGIVDAFGHVSVRDPRNRERFIMAWARAPELIEDADLLEFGLDGELRQQTDRVPYLERYIHAAVFEQRPDVMAVCHNHTLSILPFSISKTVRLRPVVHTGAVLGGEVPVWNIADEFGDRTNMLGSVVAGVTIPAVVSACINMDKNARVQLQAEQLGEYTPLAPGEIERPAVAPGEAPLPDRAWEAFVRRVSDRA